MKKSRSSFLLTASMLAMTLAIAPSARAQTTLAPPTNAPKAVDPAFAAAEKVFLALDVEARRAIQKDLIWAAKFEGTASGDFGPLTFAALKRFETEAKLPADGLINPAKRERLAKAAEAQRLAAKFTVETDKVSGMKIGIPGVIFSKSSPNTSGGTRWQDKDEKVTLDLTVFKPEDSLATLFEKGIDPKNTGRKITYKLIRPDFFVITGETASGKFYRRVQSDGSGPLRGFSIGYDKTVAPAVDKMVIAIASGFEPFPKAGSSKPATTSGTPIASLPTKAPQRRATGLALTPEAILTSEAALKGCTEIMVAPEGNAARIPARLIRTLEGTGLAVLAARAGKAMPVRIATDAKDGLLVQRDSEGDLLASAATITNGKAATSLQDGGAGAALFDKTGALIGVINTMPVAKFKVAGIVPTLSYSYLPAEDLLKASGLPAAAKGDGAAKSSAEVAEAARVSIVSLLCASDK